MNFPKSFLGLRWWVAVVIVALSIAIGVLVAAAAQHRIEPPQLVSLSAQPVYDADGKVTAFPVTLIYRITEKRTDGTKPNSWITTDNFDLVAQAQNTIALDGNTVTLGIVREDLTEVAGALYRSVHPPPLPTMQRKAIRGEPRQ